MVRSGRPGGCDLEPDDADDTRLDILGELATGDTGQGGAITDQAGVNVTIRTPNF